MRKRWKFVGIAALVLVLGLATVGAVALAQGTTGDSSQPFDLLERFRQNLASILGISVERYDSAVQEAREQTLEQAVTEGWLTQSQADRMRERVSQADGELWATDFNLGKHGRGVGHWGVSLTTVAADKLGMTRSDLLTELRGGKSIAAVAEEKGVDLQTIADDYLAQLTTNLNQAVTDGEIAQKQADWMLEQAKAQVTERLNTAGAASGSHGFRADVHLLSVAAETLGMTQSDLLTELGAGRTIADVAQERGVDPQTIVDAYLSQLTTNLNQAVADGKITQSQADTMLEQAKTKAPERLNSTWEDFGPRGHPGGHGRGLSPDSAEDDL
jgi:uncharacterized protein YidB (DUF937 family)